MAIELISAIFYVRVAVALIFSGWAGWVDWKTTDVPDLAPWVMALSGLLLNGFVSFVTGDWMQITWSVGVGLAFGAFGFGYYYAHGWGGGDAKLLTGLGFLIPIAPTLSIMPYPATFLMNVFVVGAIYSILFSFYAARKNPAVWKIFKNDIKNKGTISMIFGVPIAVGIVPILLAHFTALPISTAVSISIVTSLLVFGTMFWWRFAKIVENKVFLYKLPTSKLKEGDVIAKDVRTGNKTIKAGLIEGLTRSEVAQIRKHQKFVWVKEGVRFAPVFTLALIATLLGFALF